MELLINREYILRPKYDGSRRIRIAKHIKSVRCTLLKVKSIVKYLDVHSQKVMKQFSHQVQISKCIHSSTTTNMTDRSTAHKGDTGRCTGTWHEYTDRENFLREDYGNRFESFQEACVQLNVNPKSVDTTRVHPLPELNKRIFALMGGSLLDAKS